MSLTLVVLDPLAIFLLIYVANKTMQKYATEICFSYMKSLIVKSENCSNQNKRIIR